MAERLEKLILAMEKRGKEYEEQQDLLLQLDVSNPKYSSTVEKVKLIGKEMKMLKNSCEQLRGGGKGKEEEGEGSSSYRGTKVKLEGGGLYGGSSELGSKEKPIVVGGKEKYKTTELPTLDTTKVLQPWEVIRYITDFEDLMKERGVDDEESKKVALYGMRGPYKRILYDRAADKKQSEGNWDLGWLWEQLYEVVLSLNFRLELQEALHSVKQGPAESVDVYAERQMKYIRALTIHANLLTNHLSPRHPLSLPCLALFLTLTLSLSFTLSFSLTHSLSLSLSPHSLCLTVTLSFFLSCSVSVTLTLIHSLALSLSLSLLSICE